MSPPGGRFDLGGGVRLSYSHPQDIAGVLEVFVMDVYEVRRLRPGTLVIDLGAGVGDFAVAASRQVGPSGLVIAVEPSPGDFALLEENLRANGCSNVRAVDGVLAPDGAPVTLEFKGTSFTARGVSLPELLRESGTSVPLALSRTVGLKLDIEGAEPAALLALSELLPSVDSIAIELHGTRPEVDAILAPHGYAFYRISRGSTVFRSLAYSLRHPAAAVRLWNAYRRSPRYSGIGKILQGIDIAASDRLAVGVYRRIRPPRRPD